MDKVLRIVMLSALTYAVYADQAMMYDVGEDFRNLQMYTSSMTILRNEVLTSVPYSDNGCNASACIKRIALRNDGTISEMFSGIFSISDRIELGFGTTGELGSMRFHQVCTVIMCVETLRQLPSAVIWSFIDYSRSNYETTVELRESLVQRDMAIKELNHALNTCSAEKAAISKQCATDKDKVIQQCTTDKSTIIQQCVADKDAVSKQCVTDKEYIKQLLDTCNGELAKCNSNGGLPPPCATYGQQCTDTYKCCGNYACRYNADLVLNICS